jgi:hypothetical protein
MGAPLTSDLIVERGGFAGDRERFEVRRRQLR